MKYVKNFEKTVTRMNETTNSILKWTEGEKKLGLHNSLFIGENGNVTQYVDSDEAEEFHNYVKHLSEEEFNEICDEFFEAIKNKDLGIMHKALAVFDEMDNYSLGTENMRRRLLRIREATHEEAYKIDFIDNGIKDFIIFKGKLYLTER